MVIKNHYFFITKLIFNHFPLALIQPCRACCLFPVKMTKSGVINLVKCWIVRLVTGCDQLQNCLIIADPLTRPEWSIIRYLPTISKLFSFTEIDFSGKTQKCSVIRTGYDQSQTLLLLFQAIKTFRLVPIKCYSSTG